MTADRKNRRSKEETAPDFVGLFLLLEILLIRRSFYGFNTADEMYFIGTSERIFRGEKILIDEWNPTQQLCSFLLHPIYSLMRSVMGTTEGIVMVSRFLYLAFEGILTLFLYLRLQRRGFAAFGPVFLFLLLRPLASVPCPTIPLSLVL